MMFMVYLILISYYKDLKLYALRKNLNPQSFFFFFTKYMGVNFNNGIIIQKKKIYFYILISIFVIVLGLKY